MNELYGQMGSGVFKSANNPSSSNFTKYKTKGLTDWRPQAPRIFLSPDALSKYLGRNRFRNRNVTTAETFLSVHAYSGRQSSDPFGFGAMGASGAAVIDP